ncbi:MAG TPA: 2OG-Fe(II) oxygenase [Blastocatellia bacterium]|nr:2OG-Fe(II) oxygenase [Blastocatellia bacterium]
MSELYSAKFQEKLRDLGESLAPVYRTASPFPHIVVDDFLPEAALAAALDAFPKPRTIAHREYDDERQAKLEYNSPDRMAEPLRDILFFLNSHVALGFLEKLTGISGLISDPYYIGGGLHQIERGGFLAVHADFNKLEKLNLDRRLNALIYLNRDWKEEYGGHLELWDRSMSACAKRVLPIFNRLVVFSTTEHSFHGHPIPLSCPANRTRRSIATYYYTNGRPEEEESAPHSTLWQSRPGGVPAKPAAHFRTFKKIARSLVPPIVVDLYRTTRGNRA